MVTLKVNGEKLSVQDAINLCRAKGIRIERQAADMQLSVETLRRHSYGTGGPHIQLAKVSRLKMEDYFSQKLRGPEQEQEIQELPPPDNGSQGTQPDQKVSKPAKKPAKKAKGKKAKSKA